MMCLSLFALVERKKRQTGKEIYRSAEGSDRQLRKSDFFWCCMFRALFETCST